MEITQVTVKLADEDKLKGFVNVTFDNCFVVRGVKIINGVKGLFVAMPNRKHVDGSFRDIAHPVNKEMRDVIEKTILKAYQMKRKATDEFQYAEFL